MKRTLFILLDGLRKDYVCASTMPFLFELQQRSTCAEVIETFAFQTRPSYMAGLHPEQSLIANMFEYSPQQSPFRIGRFLPTWAIPKGSKAERVVRHFLSVWARRVERHRSHTASCIYCTTAQVPLDFLPYFGFSEKRQIHEPNSLPQPGLFDLLRRQNIDWLWAGYPLDHGTTENILAKYQQASRSQFCYLHFSELDWVGHQYGPDSAEIRECAAKLDEVLNRIFAEQPEPFNFIVFGDHGMVQVEQEIDFYQVQQHVPLRPKRDYLYFLDSTQVRFWFFNERARQRIIDVWSDVAGGHFLTESEQTELHIRFPDNRFGDACFMAHGGMMFLPNFFQGRQPIVGMHGYLPDVVGNRTCLVGYRGGSHEQLGLIDQVQIYDFLVKCLGPDDC